MNKAKSMPPPCVSKMVLLKMIAAQDGRESNFGEAPAT